MTLEKTLSELHEKLANTLLQKVKSGEVTAAELNVARQFLKDNNVDAIPKEGSPLQQLTDSLPFTGDEDTARH